MNWGNSMMLEFLHLNLEEKKKTVLDTVQMKLKSSKKGKTNGSFKDTYILVTYS